MSLEAIGAFLAGIGAVIGALSVIKFLIKVGEADCEKRLQAFRNGLEEGRK